MKPGVLFSNSLARFSYPQNYLLSFIYFSICFSTLNAQGWQWQNPLPQGNTLSSIMYINQNTIWASVWGGGSLIKSTDGGESWKVVMLPKRIYTEDVFFINENVGWTCGNEIETRNLVLGTKDGGNNWEVQLDIASFNLATIVFANEREGWVAGEAARIYHTIDGGENWNLQVNLPGDVHSLFLLDSLHVWAANTSVSGGAIYFTKDGGNTWLSDSSISWSYDIQFVDTLNGWVVGQDKIARTTDGGVNWEIQLDVFENEWTDIFMADTNYGWAITSFNTKIAKTTNGGQNWTIQDCPAEYDLQALSFYNKFNGIAVGSWGTIIKTSDGGISWTNVIKSLTYSTLFDICFINDSLGWISGDKGTILKTTDAGNNWISLITNTNLSFYNIFFINQNDGYAIGGDNTFMKTEDGGLTWRSLPNIYGTWNDIDFTYYPVGWIVSRDFSNPCKLNKTTDGGKTWNEVSNISLPPGTPEIQFTSSEIGWLLIGGYSFVGLEQLYKTTNGGENWLLINSNYSDTAYLSMHFISDSIGWISTDTHPGTVLHTIDGGQSWQKYPSPDNFRSIYFIDSTNGWGLGYWDIYVTTNGGESWSPQRSPAYFLNKIKLTNINKGFAVGSFGHIVHTTNGGMTSVGEMLFNQISNDFILFQNYPNPFNPGTKIQYSIMEPAFVSIKVYDILGREVATLVNEDKPVGVYTVNFNASTLSSGVYFYRIQTDSVIKTKKMILTK